MKAEHSEKILVEELALRSLEKMNIHETVEKTFKLTGDASTRKYYRIHTDKNSYVVCLDNPLETDEETTFVTMQRVLEKANVRVPKIIDKDLKRGYMLQEDLGDLTFLKDISIVDKKEEEFQRYKNAIDLMISIHNVKLDQYQGQFFTTLAFDKTKLFQEMEFTRKYFLNKYLGLDVETEEVQSLYKKLEKMCDLIAAEPRVLVHRDYHSRNLMIKNEQQVVIDFQDARMGTPLYDLVSLMEDCYYQIDVKNHARLIEYYYENFFKKFDPKKSFEDFKYLYDLMAVQRVFKAIGSFAYIYADRKDLRYIKYIGYAFEKVRRIMSNHEFFTPERKTLAKLYYEN